MSKDTAQIRTLNRALQNCGSEVALAEALGTSVEVLCAWLNGKVRTPVDAYIKALDLVATGKRAKGFGSLPPKISNQVPSSRARLPSWRELLADPGETGHIVQLYQDEDFYGEAISHFAAEGIARGDSIILVATKPHWVNISRRLEGRGLDPSRLFRDGQLTLLDADETLPKFMAGDDPDGSIFKPLARQTIAKARAGGRFPRVRWWGEMVNVLYVNGNPRGSNRLEEFFDEVAHEESIAIFCSFLMDKFDPKIYEEAFGNVCRTHSHVIPTDDYARHRVIVNRAIAEVVGEERAAKLQSQISLGRTPSLMPASQALLLLVQVKMPEQFERVLGRARELEMAAPQPGGTTP